MDLSDKCAFNFGRPIFSQLKSAADEKTSSQEV
jgi:hypothetical protein